MPVIFSMPFASTPSPPSSTVSASPTSRSVGRFKIASFLTLIWVLLVLCGTQLLFSNHHLLILQLGRDGGPATWDPSPQTSVFNDIEYIKIDNSSLSNFYEDFEIQSLQDVCKPRNHTSQRAAACCLGSSSTGGEIFYSPDTCRSNRPEFNILPAVKGRQDSDPNLGFRTAAHVLILLGNRTLSFVGDSLMNQMYHAFQCGIFRQLNANMTELHYQSDGVPIVGNDTRPGPNWRYSISSIVQSVYQYQHIISKVNMFLVYRPWMPMDGITLLQHPSDVYFFNFGLHYRTAHKELFQTQIGDFLQFIISNTTTKSIIYRETSAQHAFTVGGEYDGMYDPSLGVDGRTFNDLRSACTNTSLVYNQQVPKMFRESWFAEMTDNLGIRVVRLNDPIELKRYIPSPSQVVLYILPYYEYTSRRAPLHPGFFENECDISHYCYYPHFYYPIWDELYRILQLIQYHRST